MGHKIERESRFSIRYFSVLSFVVPENVDFPIAATVFPLSDTYSSSIK